MSSGYKKSELILRKGLCINIYYDWEGSGGVGLSESLDYKLDKVLCIVQISKRVGLLFFISLHLVHIQCRDHTSCTGYDLLTLYVLRGGFNEVTITLH